MLKSIKEYLLVPNLDTKDSLIQSKLLLTSSISFFLGIMVFVFANIAFFLYQDLNGYLLFTYLVSMVIAIGLLLVPMLLKMGYHLWPKIVLYISLLLLLISHAVTSKIDNGNIEPVEFFLSIMYLMVFSLFPFVLFSKEERNLNFILYMCTLFFIVFHDFFLSFFGVDTKSLGIHTETMEIMPYLLFMINLVGGGTYYHVSLSNSILQSGLKDNIEKLKDQSDELDQLKENVSEPVLILDENHNYFKSNKSFNKEFNFDDQDNFDKEVDYSVIYSNIDFNETRGKLEINKLKYDYMIFKSNLDADNLDFLVFEKQEKNSVDLLKNTAFLEKVKSALELSKSYLWLYDLNTHEFQINKEFLSELKLIPNENNILFWSLMDRVISDQRTSNNKEIEKLISGKSDNYESDLIFENLEGSHIPVHIKNVVIKRDVRGNADEFFGIFTLK